jgi:hypothetical protein
LLAADALVLDCAAGPVEKENLKQDQFGILAQFFSRCGKLRLANFANAIFIARLRLAVKCRVGNCRANDATIVKKPRASGKKFRKIKIIRRSKIHSTKIDFRVKP